MNVQDVEKELNITRANIRFYEREGLLSPTRKENGYRDYSDEDIAQLKRIIILRKLGITVADINKIFKGELSLQTSIDNNIDSLYKQISKLNGAIEVCRIIKQKDVNLSSFPQDHYWELLNQKEQNGEKFNDIFNDYFNFEKFIFFNVFAINFDKYKEKYGIKGIVIILLLFCIVSGLTSVMWQNSFWEGFITPIFIFIVISLLFLPIYYYGKKNSKIAGLVLFILFVLICLIFSSIALLLLYGLINTIIG